LIEYGPRATRQVIALRHHYENLDRPEATRGLIAALEEAERRIERNPAAGLAAPRPYPRLARPGIAWIKAGRYWLSYTTDSPPVIVGVFYETANIPGRL
jgi:plasmid stabilization system protein ParE